MFLKHVENSFKHTSIFCFLIRCKFVLKAPITVGVFSQGNLSKFDNVFFGFELLHYVHTLVDYKEFENFVLSYIVT